MAIDPLDAPYAGRIAGREHRYAVRVFYEDTDAGGVVYHAQYLGFFERARSDMLLLVGADYIAAMADEGAGYVVAEAELKYARPARLGDALVIVSTVERIRSAAVVVHQRVMRDHQLVVDGRVTVAFVGPDGRPRRQPKAWIAAFEALTEGASAPS